jgi:hypothetical protein
MNKSRDAYIHGRCGREATTSFNAQHSRHYLPLIDSSARGKLQVLEGEQEYPPYDETIQWSLHRMKVLFHVSFLRVYPFLCLYPIQSPQLDCKLRQRSTPHQAAVVMSISMFLFLRRRRKAFHSNSGSVKCPSHYKPSMQRR